MWLLFGDGVREIEPWNQENRVRAEGLKKVGYTTLYNLVEPGIIESKDS